MKSPVLTDGFVWGSVSGDAVTAKGVANRRCGYAEFVGDVCACCSVFDVSLPQPVRVGESKWSSSAKAPSKFVSGNCSKHCCRADTNLVGDLLESASLRYILGSQPNLIDLAGDCPRLVRLCFSIRVLIALPLMLTSSPMSRALRLLRMYCSLSHSTSMSMPTTSWARQPQSRPRRSMCCSMTAHPPLRPVAANSTT
jgi:hypothetical protein